MGPSEGDDRPKQVYDEPDRGEDRPMSPIQEAQLRLGETLSSVNSAVNRLTRQLMPVASDNLRKMNESVDKLASISTTRERRGSSPTLEMIEQQNGQAQTILTNINRLAENLEV